jgi:hypothetical protein
MEVSGQLRAPAALPNGDAAPNTYSTEGWVDFRAIPDVMEKREIYCCCLESNPNSTAVQPIAYSLY